MIFMGFRLWVLLFDPIGCDLAGNLGFVVYPVICF